MYAEIIAALDSNHMHDREYLRETIAYLVDALPRPALRTTLTKYVYLADMVAAAEYGRRLTTLQWRYHHHGPYDEAVIEEAAALDVTRVVAISVHRGANGPYFRYSRGTQWEAPQLPPWARGVLGDVVERYGELDLDALLEAVYETPPMMTAERGAPLVFSNRSQSLATLRARARAREASSDDPLGQNNDAAAALADDHAVLFAAETGALIAAISHDSD